MRSGGETRRRQRPSSLSVSPAINHQLGVSPPLPPALSAVHPSLHLLFLPVRRQPDRVTGREDVEEEEEEEKDAAAPAAALPSSGLSVYE